jgi:hypothetical protein
MLAALSFVGMQPEDEVVHAVQPQRSTADGVANLSVHNGSTATSRALVSPVHGCWLVTVIVAVGAWTLAVPGEFSAHAPRAHLEGGVAVDDELGGGVGLH